ncbi:hypothetical protein [Streptomyces liangshanensis]|uniref:hypothetical protein n=1 Tax=Streptomyces liangshanensis TaxID=2717324 RepID=UPI0036DA78E7
MSALSDLLDEYGRPDRMGASPEKNTNGDTTAPEAPFTPADPVLTLTIIDALCTYQGAAQTETLRHPSQRQYLAEHLAGVLRSGELVPTGYLITAAEIAPEFDPVSVGEGE